MCVSTIEPFTDQVVQYLARQGSLYGALCTQVLNSEIAQCGGCYSHVVISL
jgi:hypothetical protein